MLAVGCVLALALAAVAAQPPDAWAGNSYEDCGDSLKTEMGGDPLRLCIEKKDESGRMTCTAGMARLGTR